MRYNIIKRLGKKRRGDININNSESLSVSIFKSGSKLNNSPRRSKSKTPKVIKKKKVKLDYTMKYTFILEILALLIIRVADLLTSSVNALSTVEYSDLYYLIAEVRQ